MQGHKFADKLEVLHKKYGPMMSLCLVGWNVWDIWITDFNIIKEVLHDSRFASREASGLWLKQRFDTGLCFTPLETAKVKRKVMSQFLGSLGVGKSCFTVGIGEEADKLMKHLQKHMGQQIDCRVCLLNSLSILCFECFVAPFLIEILPKDFLTFQKCLSQGFCFVSNSFSVQEVLESFVDWLNLSKWCDKIWKQAKDQ